MACLQFLKIHNSRGPAIGSYAIQSGRSAIHSDSQEHTFQFQGTALTDICGGFYHRLFPEDKDKLQHPK